MTSNYLTNTQEFDGSDSGASPDEAVSWGKIKLEATPVKVSSDATLVFPLIVSQTFYKEAQKRLAEKSKATTASAVVEAEVERDCEVSSLHAKKSRIEDYVAAASQDHSRSENKV